MPMLSSVHAPLERLVYLLYKPLFREKKHTLSHPYHFLECFVAIGESISILPIIVLAVHTSTVTRYVPLYLRDTQDASKSIPQLYSVYYILSSSASD